MDEYKPIKDYKLIKDYKHNEVHRKSFVDLAQRTFEIDFEAFYQNGFWGDDYICYSYIKDDVVVSNVSLSTMELISDGKKIRAIQIGTVMTDPLFRRQGLAYQLMMKIFEDYDTSYSLYFLAADEEAIPLYAKCGFIKNPENMYRVDVVSYPKLVQRLTPIQVSSDRLVQFKKQSQPLSKVLSAVSDDHVLLFYYMMGFKDSIYLLTDDVYVIFEIEESCLNLYTILSKQVFDLQHIIESIIPEGVTQVKCYFTPDQELRGLTAGVDTSSSWMVRSTGELSFPPLARFPRISQT